MSKKNESPPADDLSPEESFRNSVAIRAIGGGVWDYEIETGVLHCNPRWHEILGLDPATQAITSVAAFQRRLHPDDVEAATRVDVAEIKRLVAEQERYVAEFRVIRPDGDLRRIRSVACLVEADGQPLRAIGCITDVTDTAAGARDAPPIAFTSISKLAAQATTDLPEVALTTHERECLWWVSYGKTAWETAAILDRSPRTVEFHLANAIRKLGAANKVHAAVLAIRRGLL